MEFNKISPGVWKPTTVGDTMEGVLISSEVGKKFGGKVYHLETPEGGQVVIFSTTVLEDRMSYVKVGDYCKIVFNGTQKNAKGQATKMFDVYKAKVDGEESSTPAAEPAPAAAPVPATVPTATPEPATTPAPTAPAAEPAA